MEETRDEGWRSLDAVVRPEDPGYVGWYAVALSEEVAGNRPFGTEFLGERVVIYRRDSGEPVVLRSRCPHMGADLALGDVVGDDIRCTYHHFCFAPDGRCSSVPSSGPIPPAARVRSFPSVERFGLVWAWNGPESAEGRAEAPLFAPPEVRDHREEDLLFRARRTNVFDVAPWLNIGNTFDFMHLRYVHGLEFDFDPSGIRYVDDHHIELEIQFESPELGGFEQRIRVTGTNVVSYVTVTEQPTVGIFTSTPLVDSAQSFYVAAVAKDPKASPEDLEKRLAEQDAFGDGLLADDARTLTGIRFQVGALVAEDQAMARYLRWVERFPVATARDADAGPQPR